MICKWKNDGIFEKLLHLKWVNMSQALAKSFFLWNLILSRDKKRNAWNQQLSEILLLNISCDSNAEWSLHKLYFPEVWMVIKTEEKKNE